MENEEMKNSDVQEMEHKDEKKEYGGCLTTLLYLGMFGCLATICYDVMIGLQNLSEGYTFLVPLLLITQNLMLMAGIYLLLKFKKLGLYIYMAAQVFGISIKLLAPEQVADNAIGRAVFATGLIIILLAYGKDGNNGFKLLR